MKKFFLLLFITALCNPYIPRVNATILDSESFSVVYYPLASAALNYNLSYPTLYQGDNAHMNVTLIIDYTPINCIPPKEVVIKWLGLRFDWMNATEWIQKDLEPITIEHMTPSEMVDFGKFEFQVPMNAIAGSHTFKTCIKYDMLQEMPLDYIETTENETIIEIPTLISVETWIHDLPLSKSYDIEVHSVKEKKYYELKPILLQQLAKAAEKSYLSSGARDVLQQATSEYNDATSLATQNKWSEAYEALQLVQGLLNRVPIEEDNFIMLIAGGGIGGIAVIGFIIYVLRRKSPKA